MRRINPWQEAATELHGAAVACLLLCSKCQERLHERFSPVQAHARQHCSNPVGVQLSSPHKPHPQLQFFLLLCIALDLRRARAERDQRGRSWPTPQPWQGHAVHASPTPRAQPPWHADTSRGTISCSFLSLSSSAAHLLALAQLPLRLLLAQASLLAASPAAAHFFVCSGHTTAHQD